MWCTLFFRFNGVCINFFDVALPCRFVLNPFKLNRLFSKVIVLRCHVMKLFSWTPFCCWHYFMFCIFVLDWRQKYKVPTEYLGHLKYILSSILFHRKLLNNKPFCSYCCCKFLHTQVKFIVFLPWFINYLKEVRN